MLAEKYLSKKLRRYLGYFLKYLDFIILVSSIFTCLYWVTGRGLFYSDHSAVMSPFTSLSLMLMTTSRLASRHLFTWSTPMSLALLGIVACGNFSSLWIQLISPELFLNATPWLVPTSIMTSVGIIAFCFYEMLIALRKTPDSAFIMDDILLHIALFPGGLSLLGLILGVEAYMSSSLDQRVGISLMEIFFMGAFATVAVVSNPNLFLWRFIASSNFNRVAFILLFVNQYVAPVLVGLFFRSSEMASDQFGIEFYVMVAGVMATLIFLVANAVAGAPEVAPIE